MLRRLLFVWMRWQWARLLGHRFVDYDTANGRIRVCSCGIEWTLATSPLSVAAKRGGQE